MALPELQHLNVMGALAAGQQNALRGMQMQQVQREEARKNQLAEIMKSVDWSNPEQSLRALAPFLGPDTSAKLAMEFQAMKKEREQQDEISKFLQRRAQSGMVQGGGPTSANLSAGMSAPADPNEILALAARGGSAKGMADLFVKLATPHNTPEGSISRDLLGNVIERPKIGEGMMGTGYDAFGRLQGVKPIPGYVEGLGGIEGAKEAAKAKYNIRDFPVPGVLGATRPMSVLDYVTNQSQPIVRGEYASEDAAKNAALDAAEQGRRVAIQGPGRTQTPGERETETELAKQDVARVTEFEKKIPQLAGTIRRIDRMKFLTQDDRTYAAAGAEIKKNLGSIAQAFGLQINPSETANTEQYIANVAELLKDRLASKDYGSGTGISNLDLIAAEKPLPELAKTAQGRMQILDALRKDSELSLQDATAARAHFSKHKSLRDFTYPSESVQFSQPSAATKPAAATNKAKASAGEQVFVDANGNRAVKRNGQFVEVE